MQFSDERTKSFEYDEEEYKIFWDDRLTGEQWEKGKNFYNLRFIQNKDLPHKKMKVIKNKTSSQKISVNPVKMYVTPNS